MRNDYFTLTEIARVVKTDPGRMKRIFDKNEDFPVKRVGSQYVIPKDQFFTWWDRHKNDNALRFRFDAQSIEKSRDYCAFALKSALGGFRGVQNKDSEVRHVKNERGYRKIW